VAIRGIRGFTMVFTIDGYVSHWLGIADR
jgi:hypothetical protein